MSVIQICKVKVEKGRLDMFKKRFQFEAMFGLKRNQTPQDCSGRIATALRAALLAVIAGGCATPAEIGNESSAALIQLIDESSLQKMVEEFAPIPRSPASEGFDNTLDYIHEKLKSGGFTPLRSEPADGAPPASAPPAYTFVISDTVSYGLWIPVSARLEIEGPGGFVVADTRTTLVALALNSKSTPPGGVSAPIYNLGNGTYPQEYEGIDVTRSIVYGRKPLRDIYRAAVVERGALGVISPAAPVWQGTDDNPALVAVGRVGPEGFGFKISPESAVRLERAIAGGGGSVRARATVNTTVAEGGVLRTLVAEIPGSEIPLERVALIAPFSSPIPGAADLSGAAVVAEAAVALWRAIVDGRVERPRRGIIFVWGAALMGTRSLTAHYPEIVEELHSATVVNMVGRRRESDGGTLLVERVPDPSSLWTRPPDSHTEWGAARPPHWPFRGHYLSELSEAVARNAGTRWPEWKVGRNPFEGGSDHDYLLEMLIPAQRLWNFPDPYYRSSMDTPDRTDPQLLAATTLAIAAIAYETALADPHTAILILELVEEAARQRMSVTLDQATRNLAEADSLAPGSAERGGPRWRLENDILNAWKLWYAEALDSVLAHPMAEEAEKLKIRVAGVIYRLETEWSDRMIELGLAPLPIPERFFMGLPRP